MPSHELVISIWSVGISKEGLGISGWGRGNSVFRGFQWITRLAGPTRLVCYGWRYPFVTGRTSISIPFYRDVTGVTARKRGKGGYAYIHTLQSARSGFMVAMRVPWSNEYAAPTELGGPGGVGGYRHGAPTELLNQMGRGRSLAARIRLLTSAATGSRNYQSAERFRVRSAGIGWAVRRRIRGERGRADRKASAACWR
jgi:hypothetical protein